MGKQWFIYYFGADAPWHDLRQTGFYRRNTCLLQALAKSDRTARVLVCRRVSLPDFLRLMRRRRTFEDGKVRDVYFTALVPSRWPGQARLNRLLFRAQVRWQAGRTAPERRLVWSYWPAGFLAAEAVGLRGTWVFDADHNIVEDANADAATVRQRIAILARAGNRCRYLLAASRSMIGWWHVRGMRQTVYLRNGVDPERFAERRPVPPDLADIPHPWLGYVGSISRWIDYDLFYEVAARHPQWHFVVLGKKYKLAAESKSLERLPNVHFLGFRPPAEVPAYLQAFDVGLGFYRRLPWLDVDSMKLYEYLAAGTPVVSTDYHAHLSSDFGGGVYLVDNAERWTTTIGQLLAAEASAPLPSLAEMRWQDRVRELLSII